MKVFNIFTESNNNNHFKLNIMNTYNIYKKRDGQAFKLVGDIYASNFDEAKKEFALNMTKDNWNKSNDICWLDQENDGVETGWYDMNASCLVYKEDGTINEEESELEIFCLEQDINQGFDAWTEDVYTWELRDVEAD